MNRLIIIINPIIADMANPIIPITDVPWNRGGILLVMIKALASIKEAKTIE